MAFAPVGYGPNLNFPMGNRGVGFADQANGNTNNVNGIGNTVTNNNTNNIDQSVTNNDGRTINNITINYNEAPDTKDCKGEKGKGKAKGKGKGKGKGKAKKGGRGHGARRGQGPQGPQSPQRTMMKMMKMMMSMMSQMQGGGQAGGGYPGNSVNINMGGFRNPGFF
jgi:hypothetical protein